MPSSMWLPWYLVLLSSIARFFLTWLWPSVGKPSFLSHLLFCLAQCPALWVCFCYLHCGTLIGSLPWAFGLVVIKKSKTWNNVFCLMQKKSNIWGYCASEIIMKLESVWLKMWNWKTGNRQSLRYKWSCHFKDYHSDWELKYIFQGKVPSSQHLFNIYFIKFLNLWF